MRRFIQRFASLTIAAAAVACGFAAGCGGGSSGGIPNPITAMKTGLGIGSGGGATGSKTADLVQGGVSMVQAINFGDAHDEDETGRSVAVAITNKHGLYDDANRTDYVTLVGLTVAQYSSRGELTWYFGILNTNEVGAYSGPRGYIFITRGALAQMQDEAELAGVLAHEIAHVSRNHGIEAVKTAMKAQAGEQLAFAGQGGAFNAKLTDLIVDQIVLKGFSQQQEREADQDAVALVIAAGYDPGGLARFLHRLEQLNAGSKTPLNLMSTHPPTADRIAAVEALIAAKGTPKGATLRERFTTYGSMR